MIDHVEQIFELPKVKKTFLAKKKIYEGSDLNRKSISCITDNVERIYYISTFDNRFGIPDYITEDFNYTGIEFLWVGLKNREYKKTAMILQQCIPKPTVITLDYKDEIQLSVALKRNSVVNNNKVVIEEYYFSHLFDMSYLSEDESKFIDSVKIGNLDYSNLYKMYLDLCNKIFLSRFLEVIGLFPGSDADITSIREKVTSIEENQKEAIRIENEYARTTNFAKRMQLHMELVKTKKEIKRLTQALKGVCSHGKAGYEVKGSSFRKHHETKGTISGDSNGG